MSNTTFRFRQFTIAQDKCAMKVSTDACIFGAWAPVLSDVKKVLDIGTGTGLLALMLVQKNASIHIDAVEYDAGAASQAKENITAAAQGSRINVVHEDVRTMHFPGKYDMIICNPPFFNNSLKGPNEQRNAARHTITLTYVDVISVIIKTLSSNGYAAILLPTGGQAEWEYMLMQQGMHIQQRLFIRPFEHSVANRVVSLCGFAKVQDVRDDTLVIYNAPGAYTESSIDLLAAYYYKDMPSITPISTTENPAGLPKDHF